MTDKRFKPIPLRCSGLFVTATDTDVGKTLVTCGIAALLRRTGLRVGVAKPFASGCRLERDTLVSPDAEALAHFADTPEPLAVVNPIRYRQPIAPAVAAEAARRPVDEAAMAEAMVRVDGGAEVMLVEGAGGILCPIDRQRTMLELAVAVGYPVLVVTRPDLGTLNHTALTCRAIRQAGLKVAGLVINRYDPDSADASVATNPTWLSRMNRADVLATVPEAPGAAPERGELPPAVVEALDVVDWTRVCRPQRAAGGR